MEKTKMSKEIDLKELQNYITFLEDTFNKQQKKIEQLKTEVEEQKKKVKEWQEFDKQRIKLQQVLEKKNTKLKEQVKELKGDSDLAYNLLNEEMRKKMFPNGRRKFSL